MANPVLFPGKCLYRRGAKTVQSVAQCIEMLRHDPCRAFVYAPLDILARTLELDVFEAWLLCMRLDGASTQELGTMVGVTPQHIQRKLTYARRKLQHPRRHRVFGHIVASR